MSLQEIKRRIGESIARRAQNLSGNEVRLVAVSKFQSIESIVELYQSGQRVFGENYIQELLSKSSNSRIISECPDIEWRFIGHLQKNKANQMMRINQLKAIETIDSLKIAKALNKACVERSLEIMIQINTSKEENKNGILPEETLSLIESIDKECPQLKVTGLMTIGRQNHDWNKGLNPDFQTLISCGQQLKEKTGKNVELSFGMSSDFEKAIEMGSNEVRIGTALFGERNKQ